MHIVADTLGSVAVIISSSLIQWKGWVIADPICSFCISILIFAGTYPLLKGSSEILLQCTPEDFEKKQEKCFSKLLKVPGVIGYRNPHFWVQNKDQIVGTIHVQINDGAPEQKILAQTLAIFRKKGVKNMTIEISR